jgi:hypothetical protein
MSFTKQAILMRRSFVLSLPLQLAFPVNGLAKAFRKSTKNSHGQIWQIGRLADWQSVKLADWQKTGQNSQPHFQLDMLSFN